MWLLQGICMLFFLMQYYFLRIFAFTVRIYYIISAVLCSHYSGHIFYMRDFILKSYMMVYFFYIALHQNVSAQALVSLSVKYVFWTTYHWGFLIICLVMAFTLVHHTSVTAFSLVIISHSSILILSNSHSHSLSAAFCIF